MNVFGSRGDDPLLQHDPLAPSPEDRPSDDGDADSDASDRNSTFRRPDDPEETDRCLVYTREEAAEGKLEDLNRALRGTWRLDRIQVREDEALAFVLRRDESGSPWAAETIG